MYARRLTEKHRMDGVVEEPSFHICQQTRCMCSSVLALAFPTYEYPTPRRPTVGPPKECGHELGLHKSWTHP